MSDLTTFRDHCRKMATGGPPEPTRTGYWCTPIYASGLPGWHTSCHEGHKLCRCSCHDAHRPTPPTEAERRLWSALADEIDAHLSNDDEPLWGEPE